MPLTTLTALADSLAPDPDLPVDVWADTYQVIPKDSGANEYGKFRTSRTPHARAVMQALSDHHPCKRVVLMGASQMLKTQTGLNWLMASIHQSPANFLWILPTGKLAKRASTRIAKTLREAAEAQIARLKLDEMRGKFLVKTDFERHLFNAGRMLRDTLTNCARRIGAEVSGLTTAEECEAVIDREHRAALASFSQQLRITLKVETENNPLDAPVGPQA